MIPSSKVKRSRKLKNVNVDNDTLSNDTSDSIGSISIPEKANSLFMHNLPYLICKYFFWALFVAQCIAIIVFNFTQNSQHLGFDASSNYLQAIEIWKTKTIMLEQFEYTTAPGVDSVLPIVALLYGITNNIFVSFSIVNIITTAVLILLFVAIARQLKLSDISTLIGLNLFLAPYIDAAYNTANPLDYFTCMFFSAAYYALSVIMVMLAIYTFLLLKPNDKISVKTAIIISITTILFLLAGYSRGATLFMYFVFPAIIFCLIETFAKNDLKFLFSKRIAFSGWLAVVLMLGMVINALIASLSNQSTQITIISFRVFWDNFLGLLLGVPLLFNAFSNHVPASLFSLENISQLCRIFILIVTVIAFFYVLFSTFKDKTKCFERNGETVFLLVYIIANYLLLALINSKAGSEIFESRYLIYVFVCGILLLAKMIDTLSDKLILKRALIYLFLPIILINSATGYYYLNRNKGVSGEELVEVFQKYDAKEVYVYRNPELDYHLIARNLRVLDTEKVYKLLSFFNNPYHWGDYTYYDDISDNDGPVLLLIAKDTMHTLPECFQNAFVFCEDVGIGEIYYAAKDPVDLEVGLPTHDNYSIDTPTNYYIKRENGEVNSAGLFITNGTAGYSLYGPYADTQDGVFEFKLNYKVLSSNENNAALFDIAVTAKNGSLTVLADEVIKADQTSVTLRVDMQSGGIFEYRVYTNEGTIIQIENIEITRIS